MTFTVLSEGELGEPLVMDATDGGTNAAEHKGVTPLDKRVILSTVAGWLPHRGVKKTQPRPPRKKPN
jgi:hypothetical protein